MYHNLNILSDIDVSSYLINIGIQITSVASVLSCLTAAIKTLQAISKDNLLFFLSPFSGDKYSIWGQPIATVILTYVLSQSFLFMRAIDVMGEKVGLEPAGLPKDCHCSKVSKLIIVEFGSEDITVGS